MIEEPVKVLQNKDGWHVFSANINLSVIPQAGDEGKAFIRNGIRLIAPEGVESHIRWLVGELNGVRVYTDGSSIILTTKDLKP